MIGSTVYSQAKKKAYLKNFIIKNLKPASYA